MRLRFIIPTLLLAQAFNLTYSTAEARKIRTKHNIPRVSEKSPDMTDYNRNIVSLTTDSVAFCDSIIPAVRFYGFDKTAGSNMESLFITNSLPDDLSGLEMDVTYIDMKGRQLHKRRVTVECDIPSGETKRTDFKSWDTQKSFYYHKSAKPKRQATPFEVKINLISVIYKS